MFKARNSFQVECPSDRVFAFFADSRNEPQWNPACRQAALETDEPLGEGTVYRLGLRFMGRSITVRQTIETYEPGRRLVLATLPGSPPMRIDYSFEAASDRATRIRVAVEGDMSEFLGIMPEKLFEPLFQNSLEKDARRQRACLEAEISAE